MYIDTSLRSYLDDLAAKKPAPGGGSAAALAAAISASLMSMVANYTAGNPRYREHEGQAADIMVRVQQLNGRLYGLIDEDVAAYERLSRHMKEMKADAAAREQAYRDALNPPFEVCGIMVEALRICRALAVFGNANLISDIAVAAILGEAAFLSARYNVEVNARCLTDGAFRDRTRAHLAGLGEEVARLRSEITERCDAVMMARKG